MAKKGRGPPQKGPGKYYRIGMSLMECFQRFPDNATAEQWFVETRWPSGVQCPACASDNVQARPTRKPQPYRCRSCRTDFSAKTGTLMQGSNLGFQTWVIALYLLTTGLKGTSSMKLHRDLGVTQKTAWHLAQRGRGSGDQQARAARDFAADRVAQEADVFTDDLQSYDGMPNRHQVRHSVGEYVNDKVHVNGMESFWSMLKRGYYGTYHRMSPAHIQRYVNEFSGRHNQRPCDTELQMTNHGARNGREAPALPRLGGRATAPHQHRDLTLGIVPRICNSAAMGRTTKRERGRPRKQQSGASGSKRGPGRPPKIMPTPIPATLDELARAIMQGPPKKEWDYLKAKK